MTGVRSCCQRPAMVAMPHANDCQGQEGAWYTVSARIGDLECLHPALYADVARELDRARAKHGWLQTPAGGALSDSEAFVVLVEEIGEVARAMTYDEGDESNLDAELTQVATMALAMREGRRRKRALEMHAVASMASEKPVQVFDGNGEDVPLKVYEELQRDTGEMSLPTGLGWPVR